MRRWLPRVVTLVGVAVFLGAFATRIDRAQLARALEDAAIAPILVATALGFAALWCKACCWHIMLAPAHHVATSRLFRYTIVAFAGSAVAPIRAGEVVRVWLLEHRDGVPITASAGTAICEKIFDAAAMFMLVAPVPWLIVDLPSWVRSSIAIGSLVVVAIVCALVVAVRHATSNLGRSWWLRLLAAMHVVREPRRALASYAMLVAAWLIDLGMVELVLYAVGIPLSPAAALVVLLTINLAIAVPTTPAQVGVHEAGALAGLMLFHVAPEPAFAFALIYHALQIVPVVVVGLALEYRLVLGNARANAAHVA